MSPNRYRGSYTPRSIRRLRKQSSQKVWWSVIIGILIVFFLFSWGLPLIIGGLSFLNKFKAAPVDTAKVSEDTAIAPPVLNIPFEATNSGTLQISGYGAPGARVELYLDDELVKIADIDSSGHFQADEIELVLGTNNITGKVVIENKKSLPSKNIKLVYSNDKPSLEVTEPNDNTQVKGGDKKIRVSGKTDPASSLTVNGTTVIVNGDGNFSTSVDLNDGDNTISVVSTNDVGNSSKIDRKVIYSSS